MPHKLGESSHRWSSNTSTTIYLCWTSYVNVVKHYCTNIILASLLHIATLGTTQPHSSPTTILSTQPHSSPTTILSTQPHSSPTTILSTQLETTTHTSTTVQHAILMHIKTTSHFPKTTTPLSSLPQSIHHG